MRAKQVSEMSHEIINYRGYACTRSQAYQHAFAATGNHLSAERMSYGISIPVLTDEQRGRYLTFDAMPRGKSP